MAKELGPSNIRVNSLRPGMISTTFHDTFTKDAVRSNVAAGTPSHREGKASEIADAVASWLQLNPALLPEPTSISTVVCFPLEDTDRSR
jgi:NAD(P)-dependent dehydrogenase (short-subunit alcohol dehydrogenase family)